MSTNLIAKGIGIIVFVLTFCILLTGVDTVYLEAPLVEQETNVTIATASGHLVITRQFTHINNNTVKITTDLINGNGRVISLSEITLRSTNYTKVHPIPPGLSGKWCVVATVSYKYRFSLREHNVRLKERCVDL
jgi:hypothetical protein